MKRLHGSHSAPHIITNNLVILRGSNVRRHLLSDITGSDGFIELDRLTSELRITRSELAQVAGLSRDAVSKVARLRAPATPSPLRDMTDILTRVRGWAGSGQQALTWYRSQPLPSLGDQTAEALVKEGRANAMRGYLDRIAVGRYA